MRYRGKALIVDDDPICLVVARERLEAMGFAVIVREQGLGTAGTIRVERPDLLLVDVGLPDLTGDALAKLVADAPSTRGLPIVLFSARETGELAKLVRASGALGAISKNANERQFISELETLLEGTLLARTIGPGRLAGLGAPAGGQRASLRRG